MKLFEKIFKTKMFFIVLILFILHTFLFAPSGFNRIITWGLFDKLNYYIKIYFSFTLIFYFFGYGILYFLKKKTNKYLSVIHTIIIFIIILTLKNQTEHIITYFSLLAFIIFSMNIIISLEKTNT